MDEDNQAYSVGSWAGHPLYQCNYCPFNSTTEAVAQEHYADRHVPRHEPEVLTTSGLVLVADKNGREVAVLIDAEGEMAALDEISDDDLAALAAETPRRRRK
jgi:hypothetical protein